MLIPYTPNAFLTRSSLPEVQFHGLTLCIETPRWGIREGKDWFSSPPADYGFIKGFTGVDGDDVDCYVGLVPSNTVYVVDQNTMDGSKFDEHKCMLNYPSAAVAKSDYLLGHSDGHKIFRGMKSMSIEEFKSWLKNGNKSKPVTG